MAENSNEILLAENHEAAVHETTQTDAAHEAAQQDGSDNVFQELYKQMGDHHGFYWGTYHIADLPMIIYDDGFYFYSSPAAMEADGKFAMDHHTHKPVKASTLHSEHPEPPALDLSITNLILFEWFALLILGILFIRAGRSVKKSTGRAPKGIANVLEVMFVYVRDEMIRPNMPHKVADRLLPYFLCLFFFILTINLTGLLPGGHTATGTVGVTCGLALTAFFVINWTAIRESGIGAWFKHLLGGAPIGLAPIMIPIEILSLFIKPFALTIRLFANMSAGHIVLFSLLGLIFYFGSYLVAIPLVGFSVFIYLLELLVAFIQAYVFTMLTAIFVGLAIGDHAHEEHA